MTGLINTSGTFGGTQRVSCLRAAFVCLVIAALSGCVGVQKRDLDKVGRANQEIVFPPAPDEPRFVFERAIRSSGDVVPDTDDAALMNTLTGKTSGSGQPLVKPYAVAVYQGKVMVSDSAARTVRVFDVPNQNHYVIGDESGDGALSKPLGLDVDGQGNVYVADATRKAILVYTVEGKYLRAIGGQTYFDRVSSVTVDPAGERLYAIDIGGVSSKNHRIRVFDPRTGKHLFDIGTRGDKPGEFNLPRDLAIGKDRNLYVVDGGNFRVQILDRDGKFIKSFGKVGKQLGDFARPKEIASDTEGNVYVADAAFGNFQVFSAEGELLMFVGDRSEQDRPAGYMLPSGIAVDEDGRVYMVDQWFARLDVYRPYKLKPTEGYLGQRRNAVEKKK